MNKLQFVKLDYKSIFAIVILYLIVAYELVEDAILDSNNKNKCKLYIY